MDLSYDYMTDIEQQFMAINVITENRMRHLNHEFDKLMMEHDEAIGQIEEKILYEHGTEDDMVYLYTKEAEEVKEKGKGILGRIFSAIRKIFKRIKEFLFGKKEEETQLPQTVKLPENPNELIKEGEGIFSRIRRFLAGDKNSFRRQMGKAVATGAMATVGEYATTKVVNELKKFSDYVDSNVEELEKKVENTNMTPEEQNMVRKELSKASGIGTRCSKCLSFIFGRKNEDQSSDGSSNASNIDSNMSLEDMLAKRREVTAKINKLETVLMNMTKETRGLKGAINRKRDASVKERYKIEQMEALAKKKNRTPREQKKYEELFAQYGEKRDSNDKKLVDIRNTISKLKNINAGLTNAINKAQRGETKQSKKEIKSAKKMNVGDIDKILADI